MGGEAHHGLKAPPYQGPLAKCASGLHPPSEGAFRMTLEEYLRKNLRRETPHAVIDHALRVSADQTGKLSFYIHPQSVDGDTLDFIVDGNALSPKPSYDPLRRCDILRATPTEKVIRDAVRAVEAMPGDVRLSKAQMLLEHARELVADFVDGVTRE